MAHPILALPDWARQVCHFRHHFKYCAIHVKFDSEEPDQFYKVVYCVKSPQMYLALGELSKRDVVVSPQILTHSQL